MKIYNTGSVPQFFINHLFQFYRSDEYTNNWNLSYETTASSNETGYSEADTTISTSNFDSSSCCRPFTRSRCQRDERFRNDRHHWQQFYYRWREYESITLIVSTILSNSHFLNFMNLKLCIGTWSIPTEAMIHCPPYHHFLIKIFFFLIHLRMRRKERWEVSCGRRRGGTSRSVALDGSDISSRLSTHGILVRWFSNRIASHSHRGSLYSGSETATVSSIRLAFKNIMIVMNT